MGSKMTIWSCRHDIHWLVLHGGIVRLCGVYVCVCVHACMHVSVCAYACMHACVCACICVRVCSSVCVHVLSVPMRACHECLVHM